MMASVPTAPGPDAVDIFRALTALLNGADSTRNHAIALLDVDRLNEINLIGGWPAGDATLERVSTALEHSLKPGERGTRWAGDQYIVLLPGITRRAALWRTRRILACMIDRSSLSGPPLSVSAGVASYPVDGITNSALVEAAAVALRRAKRDGRGRVRASTREAL